GSRTGSRPTDLVAAPRQRRWRTPGRILGASTRRSVLARSRPPPARPVSPRARDLGRLRDRRRPAAHPGLVPDRPVPGPRLVARDPRVCRPGGGPGTGPRARPRLVCPGSAARPARVLAHRHHRRVRADPLRPPRPAPAAAGEPWHRALP